MDDTGLETVSNTAVQDMYLDRDRDLSNGQKMGHALPFHGSLSFSCLTTAQMLPEGIKAVNQRNQRNRVVNKTRVESQTHILYFLKKKQLSFNEPCYARANRSVAGVDLIRAPPGRSRWIKTNKVSGSRARHRRVWDDAARATHLFDDPGAQFAGGPRSARSHGLSLRS